MADKDNSSTVRIPATERPSLWNREAASGLVTGASAAYWLSGIAALLTSGTALAELSLAAWAGIAATASAFALAGGIAGGLIGGRIGRARMERELREGRELQAPTLWNEGIVTGYAKGYILALAFDVVAIGAYLLGFHMGAIVTTVAGVAVGTGLAAYDALVVRDRMAREYQQQSRQVAPVEPARAPERVQGQELGQQQHVEPSRLTPTTRILADSDGCVAARVAEPMQQVRIG